MLDFLGIGAQKAGTTWLYHVLAAHPKVRFPAGKEIHFWDVKRERGIDWYTDLFPDSASYIQGEITPAYAILKRSQIKEIWETAPDLRLFYILRNPIDRAWSSALMALHRAEMTLAEASDQWFMDHFRSSGSIRRGDYRRCLDNWLSFFTPDQLGLFLFDDLTSNHEKLIKDLCLHLQISPEPILSRGQALLGRKIRPGPNAPSEAIRTSLLPTLRDLYYPKIRGLESYLNVSLSHWLI